MAELSDKQDRSDTPSPEEPSSAQGPDHNEAFLNAEQKAHVRHMAKAVFDYIEALGVETNRVGQDKHSQYIATHGPIDSPEKQHEFHVEVAKHLEIATAQKRIEAHLLDQYHQRWCLQAAKILLVGVAHSIRYAMWHVDSEKAADSFANFYENQNNPRHQFIRSLLHTDHVVAVQTHALLNDLDNPNSNLGKKASESEALRLNVDRYKRTMSALAVWNEQIDLLGSELADLREERSNPETPTEYKAPDDRSYLQYIMSGWQREIREVLTEAVLMANTFLLEHFFELYNSGTVSHLTYWPVYATPHNKSPAKILKEIDPLIFSGMKDIFPSLFTEKYIRQRRVAVPTNIPEPMISSFVEKMTTYFTELNAALAKPPLRVRHSQDGKCSITFQNDFEMFIRYNKTDSAQARMKITRKSGVLRDTDIRLDLEEHDKRTGLFTTKEYRLGFDFGSVTYQKGIEFANRVAKISKQQLNDFADAPIPKALFFEHQRQWNSFINGENMGDFCGIVANILGSAGYLFGRRSDLLVGHHHRESLSHLEVTPYVFERAMRHLVKFLENKAVH